MRETRWLTADEQATWRAFLHASWLISERLDRQMQSDSGMPHGYYEILVHLSEAPGRRLRMHELAKRAQSSRSRLSHAVRRLEEAGWIRREECPGDRRGLLAVLTDEGFGVLANAARGHVEAVRRVLFDQLTDEQVAQLRVISEAVLSDAANAPPSSDRDSSDRGE